MSRTVNDILVSFYLQLAYAAWHREQWSLADDYIRMANELSR